MKTILILITGLILMVTHTQRADSIYQYELNSIDGKKISMEQFRGDVLLIVNTASECGFTPQYEGLQELHETYPDDGLQVLGFPANNFGGQEPGTEEEIAQFCEVNYGVAFPLFSKVSVRGEDIHPLFKYLNGEQNPDFTGDIEWNFEKFLIGRNGKLLRRFRSSTEPGSEELQKAVREALG